MRIWRRMASRRAGSCSMAWRMSSKLLMIISPLILPPRACRVGCLWSRRRRRVGPGRARPCRSAWMVYLGWFLIAGIQGSALEVG